MYKLYWQKTKGGRRIEMRRILKALLKTILCIVVIILFILIVINFPYAVLGAIAILEIIYLFLGFYKKED